MSDQITYDNKVDLQVATNIANINKVTASDMNEIKNVVNGNADILDENTKNIGDITTLLNLTSNTTTSAEITEGTISNVIGIKEITLYGQTEQDSTPTPTSPVNVEVVTGGNTITISDGTNSKDYEINLGIELCKIGDYQDYIYYDNGKWYKHGAIGKVVLNGSEDWALQSTNNYGIANFNCFISNYNTRAQNLIFCDKFAKQTSLITQTTTEGCYLNVNKNFFIRIKSERASTVDAFKSWLASHNVTVYYALETPTTTEITNDDLIKQLDNLYNAGLYDDTTISQTNADLPIILKIDACTNSYGGILEYIRRR